MSWHKNFVNKRGKIAKWHNINFIPKAFANFYKKQFTMIVVKYSKKN